jgi:hypothetical protein
MGEGEVMDTYYIDGEYVNEDKTMISVKKIMKRFRELTNAFGAA